MHRVYKTKVDYLCYKMIKMQREIKISFLEDKKYIEELDKIADSLGTDRSSMLRIILRDRLKFEADALIARYNKNK